MHTLLFVVVPDGVVDVEGYVRTRLSPYRITESRPLSSGGRWDACVFGGRWDGEVLPAGVRRRQPLTIENNICPIASLAVDCGALLTPDGVWHDQLDFEPGFERHARELIDAYPDGSVVALDVHS